MVGMDDPSAGNSTGDGSSNTKLSLEKIKKQLSAGTGSLLLQGPLLKRSETLRKWNQRWFTLDPSTGKMEYRTQRGDPSPRGIIVFEADSTITLSPLNIHGDHKYNGCCFYIGTPHKKEYFLCAETQVIARAWIATLRAAAVVLKAHKEAINSLSGGGSAKLGTVAAVVAAANATAREAAEEIAAEQKKLLKAALNPRNFQQTPDASDDLSIMKETLRVKDEELSHLAKELRARNLTIKELVNHLSETADAASAAAAATHSMDEERKLAKAEAERYRKEFEKFQHSAAIKLTAANERIIAAAKARDEALLEAQRWQKELAKAREQVIILEAAVVRAEESARKAFADGEDKVKVFREGRSAPVASVDRHVPEDRSLTEQDRRVTVLETTSESLVSGSSSEFHSEQEITTKNLVEVIAPTIQTIVEGVETSDESPTLVLVEPVLIEPIGLTSEANIAVSTSVYDDKEQDLLQPEISDISCLVPADIHAGPSSSSSNPSEKDTNGN